jgi:hypothetical protein
MVRDIRVAPSNAAEHSEAREYRDRDRPEIAFLKVAVAQKVISGPERGGSFREARPRC